MNNLEMLAVRRVNTIMQELRELRDIPGQLRFLNRLASRDATDGEILGRFSGKVYISDILFSDGVATIKQGGKYTTETHTMPKIKHGAMINEEMIVLFQRLEAGGGTDFDRLTLRGFIAATIDDILLGIRERQNLLAVAMLLDDFSYSRGGIVINDATWGVPSQFKSTVAVDWTDAANATPIADITTQVQNDREAYGEVRNRVTMSTSTLRLIFETDEFKDKVQLYSQFTIPTGAWPLTEELAFQQQFLARLLDGLAIELEDARYDDQLEDGSEVRKPYWPANKVELSNTADDNNLRAAWGGNAVVPETIVSSLADVGGVIGKFDGPQTGPVSWAEAPSLNPPNLTIWGATKWWPVRVRKGLNSVLTVY